MSTIKLRPGRFAAAGGLSPQRAQGESVGNLRGIEDSVHLILVLIKSLALGGQHQIDEL